MGLLDDITLGRHVPGNSPVHGMDARLKLVGIPVMIVAAFALRTPLQLGGLALPALLLVGMSGIEWKFWWRGLRALRWLFLFTVLLHLLFSPGRTLFGVAWLSLDGLLEGLLVCSQLALAILFSSLLTLTTSPREIAGALGSLLAPLERFGLPVRNLTMLLLLVLHFIPVLREEALSLLAVQKEQGCDPSRGSLIARARALRRLIAPLILRLVDRADDLSREVAAGSTLTEEATSLPPFRLAGRINFVVLAAGILWVVLLLQVRP